jgi:hypothetical protein
VCTLKTLKKKKVDAIKWNKTEMPLTPLLFNTPLKVLAKAKKLVKKTNKRQPN